MHVFIAEDEIILLNTFKEILEEEGYTVTTAKDGAEAEEIMRKQEFDLILLDIMMPKQTGFELLETLQKEERPPQAPIIILTNLESCDDIQKGKELGAVDYFVKADLEVEEVLEIVKKYAGKSVAEAQDAASGSQEENADEIQGLINTDSDAEAMKTFESEKKYCKPLQAEEVIKPEEQPEAESEE